MARKYLGTITQEMVDNPMSPQASRVRGAIGRLLALDVGKRFYSVDGTIQVENDEQRDARLALAKGDKRAPMTTKDWLKLTMRLMPDIDTLTQGAAMELKGCGFEVKFPGVLRGGLSIAIREELQRYVAAYETTDGSD